ncbi:MAG: PH domain-containing protein [Bifidobacteriaceae bacterium]|jgi:membrane protein YdbS with pleckstrin-like domain|nr:PH domain-containing protein [Bifidobacteriaceae bacterium]
MPATSPDEGRRPAAGAPPTRQPGHPPDPLFDPPDILWRRVSPKLTTAWQLTAAIPFGLALAGTLVAMVATREWWLGAGAAATAALWAWVAWLIPRRAHAIGYFERENDLLVRKGIMFRTLTALPYGRMQYLDVKSGPVMRRFNLAKLKMSTAATLTRADIPGLDASAAAQLRDHLAALGDARMAGL